MQTTDTALPFWLLIGRTVFGTSFGLLALVTAVLAMIAYRRMDVSLHRRLRILLWMPAIWIGISLWSAFLWKGHPGGQYPAWVYYPLLAALWLMLAFVLTALWRLRGARFFVTIVGLYNLFVTWLVVFGVTMSFTGAAL